MGVQSDDFLASDAAACTPFDGDVVHRTPAKIFLGPVPDWPYDYTDIEAVVGATTFLDFRTGPDLKCSSHHHVFRLPFLDVEGPEHLPDRTEVLEFLDRVHPHVASEISYWHCQAGINRSSFILATYLHRYREMTIQDAIRLLRAERSHHVLFNTTFEQALLDWWG